MLVGIAGASPVVVVLIVDEVADEQDDALLAELVDELVVEEGVRRLERLHQLVEAVGVVAVQHLP